MSINPFNLFLKIYRFFKTISKNQIQIKETLYFIEQNAILGSKRIRYKQLISSNHTSWYENFERANYIINIVKPKIIVDLGVDHGFSSFAFAFAKSGKVFAIDSFEGDTHAGLRNTFDEVNDLYKVIKSEFDISEIEFIKGYFEEIAKTWMDPIDLLHIDGFHSYDAVKSDFETWSKFFTPNTVVLFHDIVSFKETVGVYFDQIDGHKYKFNDYCGLGVWSLNENYIRQIRYFYN